MHENEFEKQVQKKMEELHFVPSDAVWKKVDKEINKDEKRRRPVFWLLLFAGLMLAGGGYYFIAAKKNADIASNTSGKKLHTRENKPHDGQAATREKKKTDEEKEKKENEVLTEATNVQKEKVKDNKAIENLAREIRKKQKTDNALKLRSKDEPLVDKENFVADKKNLITEPAQKMVADAKKNKKEPQTKMTNEIDAKDETVGREPETIKNENQSLLHITVSDSSAIKKSSAGSVQDVPVKDSSAEKAMARNKQGKKKTSSWKIGYVGSLGFSNINQSLFKSTYVVNPAYYANAPGNPSSSPGYYSPSKIKPGFSFVSGLFISKNFSKRISVSAGLNYHYYSTKIYTGSRVDSTIYLNLYTSSPVRANGYYNNGSSRAYINHYHFIELPLLEDFQLNKSEKLRVILEAGVSLSYLVGTNTLQFDPSRGVYYKDNNQFNKTQLNAATALMVGFPVSQTECRIGLQIQYGLTTLLNKNTGNPEHLFFAGIHSSFVFPKK
jgi:hypothetical protein